MKNQQRATLQDIRFWLGLILVIGSATVGARLLGSASHRVPAVVAAHSLAEGTTVTTADLEVVSVAVPNVVSIVTSPDELVGKVLAQPLNAGSLLSPSVVADSGGATTRTIALPIRAGHLPNISRGSLVDVWVTPSLEGVAAPGPATRVVADALVADAPIDVDPTSDTSISLQVSNENVQPLVQAMRDGLIDLVVVSGGAQ
jgi:hypothetical protein